MYNLFWMGNISSRKRSYAQHMETEELANLEKIKRKVIRKPNTEVILLLDVVLSQALEKNQNAIVLSLMDPNFIRDIIFNVKEDYIELFSGLLDRIVRGSQREITNLKELIEDALFLHLTPLPDDGYNRLKSLGLSNTTIYILNSRTHSNIQVPEDGLNIGKILDVLSRQEFMDEIQGERFRIFISNHEEKIRSELESILNRRMLSPVQLTRIVERLSIIDQDVTKMVARYFNKFVETQETMYRDLRQTSQYIRNFIASPLAEQWLQCFHLFSEGENKTEFERELLFSSNPDYRPLIDNIISRFNDQEL